ncbi:MULTISPECIES: pseudouridine synthase [Pseudoalteromonas]|uniref:Pseudouridine synthase n=1 Tax=Pseudoalteromonas amylolytica TaxID=1859457 RepID=A0A1S1MUC9_9GAMM|nr:MULTISPECIES: pseudouridine synthase [Pseudoalteromonas]OHU84598.1 23S rRNA pseudouridine synthase F [Pseudoalteromonas sp. JW3]OHU92493.1 23S rRNA pseudouridine synthase F [Pseudoalteromonas amylolytica]
MTHPIRLAKYLGHAGICSRRQASRLIDAGQVMVNGRPANHIDHVTPADLITVAGQQVMGPAKKVLYAYHKPVGIDCKLKMDDPSSLIHHLPHGERVYPIGRLDKDSRGLLLLTNDGELCQRLIHPDHHVEKEYWVKVDRPLDANFCHTMSTGIPIDGQLTLPCEVSLLAPSRFKIVLKQGLNRQIRKMAKHCGYRVIDLYRARIAAFELDSTLLSENQFHPLSLDALKLD